LPIEKTKAGARLWLHAISATGVRERSGKAVFRIQTNVVQEIGDIVLKLNKEEGLTVLLVEQKLPFARHVASEFC
jgi:hypothetical protein